METRRSVKRKRTTTTKKRKTARKDHCELLLAAATGCVMALSFIFINNLSTGYQQQNADNLKTIKAEENVDKARVKYESDQQKQEERFQKILKEVQKEDEKQQQEQAKLAMEQLPSNVDELEQGAFESEDDYILAKMAMAEAEDQDTEGKALVIRVILNRVEDEHFPDTIKGVVSQKNAFTPYWNGRYKKVKPDADCYNALILVKRHDWDKSHGATYFEMTSGSTWHTRNLKRLFKHGCHTFYKEK